MRPFKTVPLLCAPLYFLCNCQLNPLLEVAAQTFQQLGCGPRFRLCAGTLPLRFSNSLLCLADFCLSCRDLLEHSRSESTGLFANSVCFRRANSSAVFRSVNGLSSLPLYHFDLLSCSHTLAPCLGRLLLQTLELRRRILKPFLQRSFCLLLSFSHILQVAFASFVAQVRLESCCFPRADCGLPLFELRNLCRQSTFPSSERSRCLSSFR
mmetsp:Transcript_65774/g.174368  ORF Transcript_65774/g.174368 Transcript_65774/m.174368 type:complete len:210 (-) Transcript_65774:547-1176(-)